MDMVLGANEVRVPSSDMQIDDYVWRALGIKSLDSSCRPKIQECAICNEEVA